MPTQDDQPETSPARSAPAASPAPAKPAAETSTTTTEDKASALDAVFDKWIATLRDGEIARHTPAWNRLMAELPAIKSAILKVL